MPPPASPPVLFAILAFNPGNQLAVRHLGSKQGLAFTGSDLAMATQRLASSFPEHTPPAEFLSVTAGGRTHRVHFTQVAGPAKDPEVVFRPIATLEASPADLAPSLAAVVAALESHLADIPYLHLGENDFIYKFRPAAERNPDIYAQDAAAVALYQSRLCSAIKELARRHERSAADPVPLDFGRVTYVIPSHFGFCLGVRNAIERAYETLAANPGRRVFMLSELIHNPFVNEDLLRRGLRYLQSERGVPYRAEDQPDAPLLWDTLTPEDIVIIPAFGVTDEDKRRLVRKGIAVCAYDATCMLVEKVWKAARAYGREGYTVLIHGKHEHEETKATFSYTRRHAPAVIVRDLAEARDLAALIASPDPAIRATFHELFAGRHTPGFNVERHLDRVAVVNQTTLLMNETLEIIELLRDTFRRLHGDDSRVGGGGRRDTLCYATQVNQDALARALAGPLDAAFVIGGRNSSNTYQLYRLCAEKLGARAFFIQSEANLPSLATIDHYIYDRGGQGRLEGRPLWPEGPPTKPRILVTGGASCPDGIIQQVIHRLNGFFPAGSLRGIEAVLAELQVGTQETPGVPR